MNLNPEHFTSRDVQDTLRQLNAYLFTLPNLQRSLTALLDQPNPDWPAAEHALDLLECACGKTSELTMLADIQISGMEHPDTQLRLTAMVFTEAFNGFMQQLDEYRQHHNELFLLECEANGMDDDLLDVLREESDHCFLVHGDVEEL